jgi:hypothetical protein
MANRKEKEAPKKEEKKEESKGEWFEIISLLEAENMFRQAWTRHTLNASTPRCTKNHSQKDALQNNSLQNSG